MESTFAIIAEPNRRAILSLLAGSERSVGEIERRLRMPQTSVSKHLRVLREAGLVSDTKAGTRRLYRVEAGALASLRDYFDGFWGEALARFADEARKEQA